MSETNEQFEALHRRFELNLICRAHNALYELGLRVSSLRKRPFAEILYMTDDLYLLFGKVLPVKINQRSSNVIESNID